MKKVKGCLYIGPYAENDFGGGLGINKNKKMLESIFRDNFTKIEFETEMPLLRKLLCTLRGYTLGLQGPALPRNIESYPAKTSRIHFYRRIGLRQDM